MDRGINAQYFKMREDGQFIFYPSGYLGKGYLLRSRNQYREAFALIKRFAVQASLSLLCFVIPGLEVLGVSVFALITARYYWRVSRFTLETEPIQKMLGYNEVQKGLAKSLPGLYLWLSLAVSIILFVSFFLVFDGGRSIPSGVIGFLLFGFLVFSFVDLILRRR